jgi:acetyltransferase-like isoleucine patch superfamily enzyme
MMSQSQFRVTLRNLKNGAVFLGLNFLTQIPSQFIRHSILRSMGMQIGVQSVIYMGGEIREPSRIKIGSNTSIGHRCTLDGRGGLAIGSNVNLSSEVMIWTMEHDPQASDFADVSAPVVVEDYAWLSCRSIILPGVTIGKGAVVAAGAVVTKSVAPFTIVGGVPARKIGDRNPNLSYRLGEQGQFWFV